MLDKARNKGEKHIHYKLKKWNKTVTFGILSNISEHVTLVQLVGSLGNVNHAVSVVGKCIVGSNYEKDLPFIIATLDLICSCYDDYQYFAILNEVFYSVMYVNPKLKAKCV